MRRRSKFYGEMTMYIEHNEKIKKAGRWQVVVCGGGVSGVAAAITAARAGKKTLLIEKTLSLGGLATNGLVNYFVPMCNGRGRQVIFGMAEEMLRLAVKTSWTTLKDCWKNDYPRKEGRLDAKFSPAIFALALSNEVQKAGAEIFLDTTISDAITQNGHINGIIIESKSGREYIEADYFADCTGDADLLARAGVPTVTGGNYFTYYAFGMDLGTIRSAIEKQDISAAYRWYMGGRANLYGGGQPEGRRLYSGVKREDVNEYVLENQKILFNSIQKEDKKTFDLTLLPVMPQMRTTRRIDGDATFSEKDAYVHFDDSVCAINDFDRKDFLYEVRFGTLVKSGFDNIITAGRSASASGYGWDVLRVIPPAILTGQAAGNACSIAIDCGKPVYDIDVKKLQAAMEMQNCPVHFDDSLVPKDKTLIEKSENSGHI